MDIIRDLEQYSVLEHTYDSLESFFKSSLKNGSHSIKYGNGYLDLLTEDRGSNTTLVMFHAAVLRTFDTLPMFVGRKVTENLDANMVFVSDPSLELGINLGWYGGDQNRPLQVDLPQVISHVLDSIPSHKHLMLFGPSGGGFASLYFSAQFPKSLAIPMNPQTDISLYNETATQAYSNAAWGGVGIGPAPFCSEISPLYSEGLSHHVAYIQNLGDISHVRKYLAPFLTQVSDSDRRQIGLKLGEWGKGHKPAPGRILVQLFRDAIACNGDWNQLFEKQELDIMITPVQLIDDAEKYYAKVKVEKNVDR